MGGRNFNSETKPLRRVLTLSPSPALTPQPSTCSQSMSAELTQELMVIGRSCMRAELRSSEQKCLKHPGRKSLQNGARGQRQDCQSGLVSAQAKRLEIQRHLRVKKMLVLKLKKLRRIMRRGRRGGGGRRRGIRSFSQPCGKRLLLIDVTTNIPYGSLLPYQAVRLFPGFLHFAVIAIVMTRRVSRSSNLTEN